MTFNDDLDSRYKVLLIGESSVGKTSIIRKLKGQEFQYSPMCTIGVEYMDKTFTVNKTQINLQIWDTAGQEKFRSLTPLFYRGCKALIFVYDITKYESFKNLKTYWLNNAFQNTPDESSICTFLVGNKTDCLNREVTTEMGTSLQHEQNFLGFFETSALTGENIQALFEEVAAVTHQHHKTVEAYTVTHQHHKTVDIIPNSLPSKIGSDANSIINYISKVQCKKCRKKMLETVISRQQYGRQSFKLEGNNNNIASAASIQLVKESKCCS